MMKKLFILITMVIVVLTGCKTEKKVEYDTVIIGGGLAGLSASYELKDRKILLLEKEKRIGGRIWTKDAENYTYEMGALFGYVRKLLPERSRSNQLIKESNNVGVYIRDRVYLGRDMRSAVLAAVEKDSDRVALNKLKNGSTVSEVIPELSRDIGSVIEASFNVIHPGDFEEYTKSRKMDAFVTFNTSHYVKGNRSLINVYAKKIEGKYKLGAEVFSVEKKDDHIITRYKKDGKTQVVTSKTVIVATPATVAAHLIKGMDKRSETFLKSVKYGKGVVVAVVTKKGKEPDFSYIVTPGKSFNTVFKSRSYDDKVSVYVVYFIDSFLEKHPEMKRSEYIDITLNELRSMNIGNFDEDNILKTDYHLWKDLGTIISDETYGNFDEKCLVPLQGVVLAGDYTFWEKMQIPYGISAAFYSGKIAAMQVKELLEEK